VNVTCATIDDYLDLVIDLSDITSATPDLSFSLLTQADSYEDGAVICFEITVCDNLSVELFNLGEGMGNDVNLEF